MNESGHRLLEKIRFPSPNSLLWGSYGMDYLSCRYFGVDRGIPWLLRILTNLGKILFEVSEKVRGKHKNLQENSDQTFHQYHAFWLVSWKNCGLLIIYGMFAPVSMTQRCTNWSRSRRTGMLRLGRRLALRWNSAPGTTRPRTSFSSSAMVGCSVVTEQIQTDKCFN